MKQGNTTESKGFSYKAYDRNGTLIQGVEFGLSSNAVDRRLRSNGLTPIEIKVASSASKGGRVTSAHLEEVTAQLALLLKSGLKIDVALKVLVDNSANRALQQVLNSVYQSVQQGRELWRSLSEHEAVFPNLYVEMVHIGETSGRLPEVFEKLAENLKFQRDLNKKISQAMVYPMFILLVCVLSLFAIFNFVVPSMSGLFESLNEIPFYTQILMDVSHWVESYQWHTLFVLVLFGGVIYSSSNKPEFKKAIDKVLNAIPFTRNAVIQVERVRYSASMELMLTSGVDLAKAMGMSANSVKTSALKSQLLQAQQEVSQGRSIVESLMGMKLFDPISLSLIKVGEETGQIGLVFGEINKRSRSDFESWMLRFAAMLEPLMIVVMGGIVGSVVVVMLLSIVSVNDVSF